MNRHFPISLTICLIIGSMTARAIAQGVFNGDTDLSEVDIAAEVEQELVIDGGDANAPAPIEGDSYLLPQLEPDPDGGRDLPDTTPSLVDEAISLSDSKIVVLKPKHVAAYWARLELAEVFSEEVSSGKVKFAGSDDLLIVRTTSPNVLNEITRLLQAIDQPEKPHPEANAITAIEANDRNAIAAVEFQVEADFVRDPRHRELQAKIDLHQEAIEKLSDHVRPNSREVEQHSDEIARLEAKRNALEAALLPGIAARRAQVRNRIAPPPSALDPLQQKIQEIVAKLGAIQDSTNEVAIEHITATLRQALEQRFEARQARQTEQVNQLRKRLQTLESRIEQRANQRERILRRTMNDLLSNNDNRRQDAVETLQDPAQLASSDSTLPPPRETANRVASKQGPIALTDRVNFYYSAADIAKKEAELADKQKLYDKGYIKESELKLARTMLEGSKRAAQSIERALMTQLRMREFDLQEAKVKFELHAAEAKRVEALRKNKAVTAAEARSAIAAERLASIDMDRARAEIEAIATQLKEFHQAHSKE